MPDCNVSNSDQVQAWQDRRRSPARSTEGICSSRYQENGWQPGSSFGGSRFVTPRKGYRRSSRHSTRSSRGGRGRCIASRRRRLSRLLRLSEDWLAGEDDPPLPGLPPWLPSATAVQIPWPDSWRLSSDLEPTLDENLALYRPGAAPGFDPPRYQLEWGYLAERVIEAWKRDIEAGSQEALQAIGRLQPGVLGEENWLWVIRCVARGLGLVWWRYRALTRSPAPDVPPGTWI